MDTEGRIVEAGVEGELVTRGYSTMLGYWGDVDKTLEVITPDRWFHTGDVAVIEENGYGRIVGRMKDMIIRGGENIYPREIEEFLHTHPAIMEAQVDIIIILLSPPLTSQLSPLTSHLSPLTSQVVLLSVVGLALAAPAVQPYILPYHAAVLPYSGLPLLYAPAAPLGIEKRETFCNDTVRRI